MINLRVAIIKRIYIVFYWFSWFYLKGNDRLWRETASKGMEKPWRYHLTDEDWEREKRSFFGILILIVFVIGFGTSVVLNVLVSGLWWVIPLAISILGLVYILVFKWEKFRDL